MITVKLRGIAEGLLGKSSIECSNLESLINEYPVLKNHKHFLKLEGDSKLSGYSPCDG